MALVALAILFSTGSSLYYVPLSRARGHFTLGESGAFNYLIYVNRARPMWYLQSPGTGHGSFVHSPEKIFSSPPAYAFPGTSVVTHPLRFDPSYWIAGAKPRFVLRQQIIACIPNLHDLAEIGVELLLVIITTLARAFINARNKARFEELMTTGRSG
jgi:hypothetical protein